MKIYIISDPHDNIMLLTVNENHYLKLREEDENNLQFNEWDTNTHAGIKIELSLNTRNEDDH
jgi:hypothetical protein